MIRVSRVLTRIQERINGLLKFPDVHHGFKLDGKSECLSALPDAEDGDVLEDQRFASAKRPSDQV